MRPKDSGPEFLYWILALALVVLLAWVWLHPRNHPQTVSSKAPSQPAKQAAGKTAANTQVPGANPTSPYRSVGVATNRLVASLTTTSSLPASTTGSNTTARSTSRFSQPVLEAQLALAHRGISSGSFDGVIGAQTRAAIRAFQTAEDLPPTGDLDAATRERLSFTGAAYGTYVVAQEDLDRLLPLSDTWLGKSQQPRLDYETILELVSEKSHAHPGLIRSLNPGVTWTNVTAGTELKVPAVVGPSLRKIASVHIQLEAKTLEAFDADGKLVVHFPCSIAKRVEKRPVGTLHVKAVALGPNYTFDPEIFPESAEAKQIKSKLILQPGPNNPVGLAWIGLDLPGYGIHGTPKPEDVGRTESHGCFRLANWNAELLAKLAWIGLPVSVDP